MIKGLPEEECDNLRHGDVILVPFMVERTNNYFDKFHGMKVVVRSTESDHRPREEREKGPRLLDIMSQFIHSVAVRKIALGDWVKWGEDGSFGQIAFIEGEEAAIRQRGSKGLQVHRLKELARILPPTDLTAAEQKAFKAPA